MNFSVFHLLVLKCDVQINYEMVSDEHMHQLTVSPNNKWLVVCDYWLDSVSSVPGNCTYIPYQTTKMSFSQITCFTLYHCCHINTVGAHITQLD